MAFWDDVLSFFGVNNKPSPSPAKTGGGHVSAGGSSSKTPLSANKPSQVVGSQSSKKSTYIPASFGGGGGGGGMASMSFAPAQRTPEPSSPRGNTYRPFGDTPKSEIPGTWANISREMTKPRMSFNPEGKSLPDLAVQFSPKRAFEDAWAWLNEPVNSPKEFFQPVPGTRDRQEKKKTEARQAKVSNLGWAGQGNRRVRELSQEEWAALTPEQQEQVTANYAIYQATQSENAKESTQAVLDELGYKGAATVDQFLSGQAIANYNDIIGQATAPKAAQTVADLGKSTVFNNTDLQTLVQQGQSLIDALAGSGVAKTTATFATPAQRSAMDQIPIERYDALNAMLTDMADRQYYQRLQEDPQANQAFQTNMQAATEGLDPELVAQYFQEQYASFGGNDVFMTPQEFEQIWLRG